MSDYLSRLIDRGAGGARAKALPLVRPVADLYAPPQSADMPAEIHEETAAVSVETGIASPRVEQRRARQVGHHADDVPGVALPRSGAAAVLPTPTREPADLFSVVPLLVRATPDAPTSAEQKNGRAGESVRHEVEEESAPGPPEGATLDATPRAEQAVPPSIQRVPVAPDDIGDAIFASPPAPRQVSETRQAAAGPLVSIGRIDIEVAAPPAPATDHNPRTYGFKAYARLRRGLRR